MNTRKISLAVSICLFANTLALANKSVFIISRHSSPSVGQAWAIDANTVDFQGSVDVSSYNQGFGAVGNAVWPEKTLMFVTFEAHREYA